MIIKNIFFIELNPHSQKARLLEVLEALYDKPGVLKQILLGSPCKVNVQGDNYYDNNDISKNVNTYTKSTVSMWSKRYVL